MGFNSAFKGLKNWEDPSANVHVRTPQKTRQNLMSNKESYRY